MARVGFWPECHVGSPPSAGRRDNHPGISVRLFWPQRNGPFSSSPMVIFQSLSSFIANSSREVLDRWFPETGPQAIETVRAVMKFPLRSPGPPPPPACGKNKRNGAQDGLPGRLTGVQGGGSYTLSRRGHDLPVHLTQRAPRGTGLPKPRGTQPPGTWKGERSTVERPCLAGTGLEEAPHPPLLLGPVLRGLGIPSRRLEQGPSPLRPLSEPEPRPSHRCGR